MKTFWYLPLMMSALIISGCGGKKSAPPVENSISSQYTLDFFTDINREPTYNPKLLKDVPRTIDLKNIMTPVKNQGDRGTCSFFGTISLAESAIKSKMGIDVNLSEEYLNYAVKSRGYNDNDEGGFPLENQYVAIDKKDGFLLERDMPYQPSWFEVKKPCIDSSSADPEAPTVCYTHNKPSEATLLKRIPLDKFESWYFAADDFNEIITTLAKKTPFTAGIPIHPKGLNDNGEITYTEEMREECIKIPKLCGGHIITITGYDLEKEVFYFKNSWGKKWGQEGYGTLPFNVIDRHSDMTFGMIKLTGPIELPKDHAQDYLDIKNFEIDSTEFSDYSITIKTAVTADNVGTHTLLANSTLYARTAGMSEKLTEKNIELVALSKEEEEEYGRTKVSNSSYLFRDEEISSIKWGYEDNYVIKIPSEKMNYKTIVDSRNRNNKALVLKTTLMVYTDDSEFKPVKTIIHPLNYLSFDL